MKKTLVAILASLAMVITMIPLSTVTVSAGTPTTPNFTLYYDSENETMHRDSPTGDVVTIAVVPGWSGNGSTLTLDGFNFTTTAGTALVVPGGTTINLQNNNSIVSTASSVTGQNSDSIGIGASSYGNLTFTGGGNLTVSTNNSDNGIIAGSYGIKPYDGEIIFNGGGTIKATGGKAIEVSEGLDSNIKVSVSSGIVEATGGEVTGADHASYGIFANTGGIEVSGGKLTTTGGSATRASNGVYTAGSITVSGGELTAIGGNAIDSYGAFADAGNIFVSGGNLIAKCQGTSNKKAINKSISSLPDFYKWRNSESATFNYSPTTAFTFDEGNNDYLELNTLFAVTNGQNGKWTKGTKSDLSFTVNADYSKFTGVDVDGNPISSDKYTSKSGSTIVNLKASYLQTLAVGNHALKVNFTNGYAEANFTINPAASDNNSEEASDSSADTGDSINLALPIGLAIAALLAVAALIITGKVNRKK